MRISDWSSDVCSSDLPDWSLSLSERLLFPFDESQVPPDQQTRIETLAHRLLSVGIDTARVEGHTDSIGAESYNLALPQARAEAVAAPLRAGGMRLTPDQVIGRYRTSGVSGKRVSVRVDLRGRSIIKKKTTINHHYT